MQDFIDRYELFATQQGWAVSAEHNRIIHEIFNLHTHFTEKDLAAHGRLGKIPAKIRNRVLERLVASGLIRQMTLGGKNIFYEHVYGHAHHDHLKCIHCGQIIEFQDDKIEQRQKAVCKKNQFKMLKHTHYILGECVRCQEKKSHQMPEVVISGDNKKNPKKGVPLSTIRSNEYVIIETIGGGAGLQQRLHDMGLLPGAILKVVSNRFSGPFIIQIHESRLAIGHQITHQVMVRPYDPKDKKI